MANEPRLLQLPICPHCTQKVDFEPHYYYHTTRSEKEDLFEQQAQAALMVHIKIAHAEN